LLKVRKGLSRSGLVGPRFHWGRNRINGIDIHAKVDGFGEIVEKSLNPDYSLKINFPVKSLEVSQSDIIKLLLGWQKLNAERSLARAR
jgi:hypothetical protein